MSGNFELSQGNLKFWKKSGKSQGILEQQIVIFLNVDNITVQLRLMCLNSRDVQTFRQNI